MGKKTPTIPPLMICEDFPSTVNIIADDVNEDISFTAFQVLKHSTVNQPSGVYANVKYNKVEATISLS